MYHFCYLVWLNVQRGMLTRFRGKTSLVVYGIIHIIMSCALSSGFSIFVQGSYLDVLTPPVVEQFQVTKLANYCLMAILLLEVLVRSWSTCIAKALV
jgi:hypothetical protein